MYKIRNLANTIAQFKMLQHLDVYYEELVKNLTSVELMDYNVVKIKDKTGEPVYIVLKYNEMYIYDKNQKFCRKERID